MTFFHKYLELRTPTLASAADDTEPGPLEKVQAEIIECVGLYAEKYEEEFTPFMPALVDDVWKLLSSMGPEKMLAPNMDDLVSRSVRVLSAVVDKPTLAASFENEATLQGIITHIVVPNMTLRASDLENMEDNPVNFIRGDIEGSDADTRRRVASDLVRTLARHKPERVTPIVMNVVQTLLANYEMNKEANMGNKDAAISILMAIAIKSTTAAAGVTSVNEAVSLAEMLRIHVLPELSGGSVDERPLARAACIKFVATFRGLFGRDELHALLPLLATLLGSRHYVVHTYAAAAIERILSVKDTPAATDGSQRARPFPRVSIDAVVPLIAPVLGSLFSRMAGTVGEDNEYLMRCVMRIVAFAKERCASVTSHIMTALTTILGRVCRNPINPSFNHYMFESIACLIRATCTSTPAAVADFEALLFPNFQTVLSNEVLEFMPYVFQLLAELLDLCPPPASGAPALSPSFTSILQFIITTPPWTRDGNIPPLTSLLVVFIRKCWPLIASENLLGPILNIWNFLATKSNAEHHGYTIFNALLETAPLEALVHQQYLSVILNVSTTRIAQTSACALAPPVPPSIPLAITR